MTIPTTPLKLPIQGKPLDEDGNWTPTWARTLQLLFNRVGSYTAPSNLQLAGAIGAFVAGPASSVDGDVVVFDGATGKLIKDGSIKIAGLAPIASPAFTGIPTAPTPAAGTSTAQLATTSFVAIATSGFGNVFGPVSSISNNIVLFNGLTGKVISDSGVNLSALAPLASPTFSGIPAAPTATPGTTTTQLATTAFVGSAAALLAPLASPAFTGTATAVNVTYSGLALTAASATGGAGIRLPHGTAPTTPVSGDFWSTTLGFYGCVAGATVGPFGVSSAGASSNFSAHNNGVAQSIPTATFTKLNMSTSIYNNGGLFAASAWTPPAGLCQLFGNGFTSTVVNSLVIVSIFKNGAEFKRGTTLVNGGTNTASAHISCMDVATGSDVYDLRIYQDTGAAQNTNGATMLTWFQGSTLR